MCIIKIQINMYVLKGTRGRKVCPVYALAVSVHFWGETKHSWWCTHTHQPWAVHTEWDTLINTKYWVHCIFNITRGVLTQGGSGGSGGVLRVQLSLALCLHSLLDSNLELVSANNLWKNPLPLGCLFLAQYRNSHGDSWSPRWPYSDCSRTVPNHYLPINTTGDCCYRILPTCCCIHGYNHENISTHQTPPTNCGMLAAPCCRHKQQRVLETNTQTERSS